MSNRITAYTDAPTDYDYRWMRTEIENYALYDGKKSIRMCSNDDSWHCDSQIQRYGSGMHLGLTQASFDDYVTSGLIVLTPDLQIVHHRAVINLPDDYDYDSDGTFFKAYEYYACGEGKAENVKVESGAFGGGSKEISIYVVGDKPLFDKIVAELKEAA
jgi:hypothetical protein